MTPIVHFGNDYEPIQVILSLKMTWLISWNKASNTICPITRFPKIKLNYDTYNTGHMSTMLFAVYLHP